MSKTLVAKPIVKNQLWVITDGEQKIGNVVAGEGGYDVKIGNQTHHYASTKTIEKNFKLVFETAKRVNQSQENLSFAVWPTESNRVYNSVFDVQKKLHLYTKTNASKCYHAAGYFAIRQNRTWETVFCPKYIYLQRYEYVGPAVSPEELQAELNTRL
jgi:hypothetical protein